MADNNLVIYSNTYGFTLTIETGRDLSDTTLRLRIRNPNSINVDRTLSSVNIITPKTLGKVIYTVADGDFPIPGNYQIQLFDETAGRKLASSVIKIKVRPSLDYVIS